MNNYIGKQRRMPIFRPIEPSMKPMLFDRTYRVEQLCPWALSWKFWLRGARGRQMSRKKVVRIRQIRCLNTCIWAREIGRAHVWTPVTSAYLVEQLCLWALSWNPWLKGDRGRQMSRKKVTRIRQIRCRNTCIRAPGICNHVMPLSGRLNQQFSRYSNYKMINLGWTRITGILQ